jgi:phage-related protein
MKHHLDFYFNGEFSLDKGVFNAVTENGLYEDVFLSERIVNAELVKNQTKGYLLSIDRSLFSFTLILASKEPWTRAKLDEIATWLDVDYFKEFYFVDESERRYFVMPNASPTFTHTGTEEGYVTVEMKSISPYTFSPNNISQEYNISANVSEGFVINFANNGHFVLMPIIRIRKVGAGNVSIVNESDLGRIFEITNLADGEEVFIDNQTKEIKSEFARTYHYDDHNGNWLTLLKGNNTLRVYGNCYLEFEYRFQYSPTL